MKKLTLFLTLFCFLFAGLSFSQPPPDFVFDNPMVDGFWVAMDDYFDTVPGLNGGIMDDPLEDGTWYFYPNPGGINPFFNIWFYNGDFIPPNSKRVAIGFWALAFDPNLPGEINLVVNWDTPEWEWPPGPPGGPPTGPPLTPFDPPEDENIFVGRSPDNVFPILPGGEFQWIETWFEIPEYNPGWVSVDVWGFNFMIPMEQLDEPPQTPIGLLITPWWGLNPGGLIVHECVTPDPNSFMFEFGDAPDHSMAYIGGAMGNFPTCTLAIPLDVNDYISHPYPNPLFFGGMLDGEGDGNAGWCPYFNPDKFNMDECGISAFPYPMPPPPTLDEGLIVPTANTISGYIGSETYTTCGPELIGLGEICETAIWGQDIDIWVDNSAGLGDGFFHLLIDWNQDGNWADDPATTCNGTMVPELVVLNYPVPAGYVGPISQLTPPLPPVQIGPLGDYVWARFSLTENVPVIPNWDGHGQFQMGETEDYLLYITPAAVPISNWSIFIIIGMIAVFILLAFRRKIF